MHDMGPQFWKSSKPNSCSLRFAANRHPPLRPVYWGSRHNLKRRFVTARVSKRAVAIREFISILLKARIMAGSHLSSVRRSKTARVIWRAVAIRETTSILLNARIMAGSHLSSVRRIKTARVIWRAVEFAETTSILLWSKIWYKTVIRSSNIKLDKGDCFLALNSAAC